MRDQRNFSMCIQQRSEMRIMIFVICAYGFLPNHKRATRVANDRFRKLKCGEVSKRAEGFGEKSNTQ